MPQISRLFSGGCCATQKLRQGIRWESCKLIKRAGTSAVAETSRRRIVLGCSHFILTMYNFTRNHIQTELNVLSSIHFPHIKSQGKFLWDLLLEPEVWSKTRLGTEPILFFYPQTKFDRNGKKNKCQKFLERFDCILKSWNKTIVVLELWFYFN